ncbi:hsp90 co-chaperone Cdc37 [Sorochytrium milnesiophthora]
MSRINYSKWDNIELSDDEDIEVHPNVDKKSFVKWRQQQIHMEREERRSKIDVFSRQIPFIKSHVERLEALRTSLMQSDLQTTMSTLNDIASDLQKRGQELRLPPEVTQFFGELSKKVADAGGASAGGAREVIDNELAQHINKLKSDLDMLEKELDRLKTEESKKLSSDTICKPGFDNTRVNKKETPKTAPPASSSKAVSSSKSTAQTVEVLNPDGVARAESDRKDKLSVAKNQEELDQFITHDVTKIFATIPASEYQRSFKCISDNPWLVNQTYADEILAAAFQAQFNRKPELSRNLVHQAQILQFCASLGKDGVGMFFARIHDPSHKANVMFREEVDRNYKHIVTRSKVLLDKAASNKRTGINLTPSGNDNDAKMTVFRDIPEPVKQALLTEDMAAVEQAVAKHVKSAYDREKLWQDMRRVGIVDDDGAASAAAGEQPPELTPEEKLAKFRELPEAFGEALVSGDIDKVNEALAALTPEEAERAIRICKEGGFMDIEDEVEEEEEGDEAAVEQQQHEAQSSSSSS